MDSIKNINYKRILKGIVFAVLLVFYVLLSMIAIPAFMIKTDDMPPGTQLLGLVPMTSFLIGWATLIRGDSKYKKIVGLILVFWIPVLLILT